MSQTYLVKANDGVLRWCQTCNAQRTIFILVDDEPTRDGRKRLSVQLCCASCQHVHQSNELTAGKGENDA